MFSLSIDLDPSLLFRVFAAMPGALDARKEPMRTAVGNAMDAVMAFEQRRFRSASGGDGTWADLAPSTRLARARRDSKSTGKPRKVGKAQIAGVHFPILLDTETLERGLFEAGGSGHFRKFYVSGVAEGVAGGSHPLAPITVGALAVAHHFGNPNRHLPARTVMGPIDNPTAAVVAGALAVGVGDAFAALASGISGTQTAAA